MQARRQGQGPGHGRLQGQHDEEAAGQRHHDRGAGAPLGEQGGEIDAQQPGIGEVHDRQHEVQQRRPGVVLPIVGADGHDQGGGTDRRHAEAAGHDVMVFTRLVPGGVPGAVEILDQHRRHGVQRRHGGAHRRGDDADGHHAADAGRRLRQDEVHEDGDVLALEGAGGPGAGRRGPAIEQVEQAADGDEQPDDGDGGGDGQVQALGAGARIAAGQQALRRVLVQRIVADEQQHDAGQRRPQAERGGEAGRQVEQAQLVMPVRGRGQGLDHAAQRHVQAVQQQ
ncbi:hypothetical protein AZA_90616 [Nitrospirillum viridazoti Y2]|nr:hypothetical protein AZA_90616 [Nitrospirillum amazonense Y2]